MWGGVCGRMSFSLFLRNYSDVVSKSYLLKSKYIIPSLICEKRVCGGDGRFKVNTVIELGWLRRRTLLLLTHSRSFLPAVRVFTCL